MTEEQTPAKPDEPAPKKPPATPSPAATGLAVLLTLGLFLNLYLDSQGPYDGKTATPIIALLIAGVLGFDLSKFFRGGGS